MALRYFTHLECLYLCNIQKFDRTHKKFYYQNIENSKNNINTGYFCGFLGALEINKL